MENQDLLSKRLLPLSARGSESEDSAQALRVVDAWVAVQLVKERTKAIGPLIFVLGFAS